MAQSNKGAENDHRVDADYGLCSSALQMHHPVVKWVCEDKANLNWLYRHCSALYTEYKRQNGLAFTNIPQNLEIINNFICNDNYYQISFINFAKCESKDLDFTHLPVFEAYTKYLKLQEKVK